MILNARYWLLDAGSLDRVRIYDSGYPATSNLQLATSIQNQQL